MHDFADAGDDLISSLATKHVFQFVETLKELDLDFLGEHDAISAARACTVIHTHTIQIVTFSYDHTTDPLFNPHCNSPLRVRAPLIN